MMAARPSLNKQASAAISAETLERWSGGGLLSDLPPAWRSGFAIDVMAPKRANALAFIGGMQDAESYLLAAASLREFKDIRVYGPQPVAAAELVRWLTIVARKSVTLCASAEEAQKGADVLIFAGRNAARFMLPQLISPFAHLNYIMPAELASLDMPAELLRSAQRIAIAKKGMVDWPEGSGIKQPMGIDDLPGHYRPEKLRGRTLYIDRAKPD